MFECQNKTELRETVKTAKRLSAGVPLPEPCSKNVLKITKKIMSDIHQTLHNCYGFLHYHYDLKVTLCSTQYLCEIRQHCSSIIPHLAFQNTDWGGNREYTLCSWMLTEPS